MAGSEWGKRVGRTSAPPHPSAFGRHLPPTGGQAFCEVFFMLFSKKLPVSWLIVGLGNPGDKYDGTRHNAGFWAVDALADQGRFQITRVKFKALTAQAEVGGQGALVMKPTTYMNLSGEAVGEAARFYKLPPDHVLVFSDDVDLPLGRLRIPTRPSREESSLCTAPMCSPDTASRWAQPIRRKSP